MPPFSISQSVVQSPTLEDDLDIILDVGQRSVAIMGTTVRSMGPQSVRRHLQDRAMTVSSYHAGLRILELDDDEADRAIAATLREAAAIGAPQVSLSAGPRGGLSFAQADARYIGRLNRSAPLAGELGVAIGVEPLHPLLCANGYIHGLNHAAEVVLQVPGSVIVLDTVHVFWDRNLHADIAKHIALIGLVQLGQLSLEGLARKSWLRSPLASGAIDLANMVKACHDAGYRGVYEQENLSFEPITRTERTASLKEDADWFADLWTAH
jgi:sugar phosphate isomerase/epimerase